MWGTCSKVHINRLSRLQVRIARIILNNYESRGPEIIKKLKWMTVQERLEYNTLLLVHKCLHNAAPLTLQNLFNRTNDRHHYAVRNADISLALPKPRTEALKKSFEYHGASLWNALPRDLRIIENLNVFKTRLKAYIIY